MSVDDDDTEREPETVSERKSGRRLPSEPAGDRYQVGSAIGRGGMGEVVTATDTQIGREVAIKRMHDRDPSDRQVQRFLREARIQGRLEHPAIVPVHELGRDRVGLPYFAMKRLAGTTLRAILDTGDREKFGLQRLLRAFADVCLALEFAHVHGVLHRDVKPDNIVLGDFGEVYVLDWGVAKVVSDSDDSFDDLRASGNATIAGAIVGTPKYMAPEQARGELDLDARVDVYALGLTLAEILARDAESPPELDALVARAIEPDRAARLASARELGEHVQRYLDGDRDLAMRRRLASEQLDAARAASARGDRAAAMRAGGRALALDPELKGAAELVGRLMLEPPAEMPPAVTTALADEDRTIVASSGRALRLASLGFLVAVPFIVNASATRYWVAYIALMAMTFTTSSIDARGRMLPTWWHATMAASFLVLLSVLFTPLVVVPTVAAISIIMVIVDPRSAGTGRSAVIGAILLAGTLGPVFGEISDVLPRSFDVGDGTVLLHGAGFPRGSVGIYVSLVSFLGVSGAVCFGLGAALRRNQRELRERLHVQAWHLRQLVDHPSSPT